MFLEVIAKDIKDVIEINNSNADRIELCDDLVNDGITQSRDVILKACEISKLPVNVIVRPSYKDFFYTEDELEQMLEDVKFISGTKANGIVIGVLNKDYTINESFLEKLVKIRGNLKITFHKAFDLISNMQAGIDILSKFNIDCVLTSGGKDINTGLEILSKLNPGNTKILIGGGVNLDNIKECLKVSENIHIGTAARTVKNWDSDISIENINKFKKI